MRRSNCLIRALDQWQDNPKWFWLWYNSNHVISLEIYYNGNDLIDYGTTPELKYLQLSDYGYEFFVKTFGLNKKYQKILKNYLQYETQTNKGEN